MNDSSRAPLPILYLAASLLVSILTALAAFGVGHALPSTFQNSGTIRVGTPTQSGIGDTNVLAENDLTSQYVQLVNSSAVAGLTGKMLGVSAQSLSGQITGSTVAAENLLQVAGSGNSPRQATARTTAAVRAVQAYLIEVTAVQNRKYENDLVKNIAAAVGTKTVPTPIAAQTDLARVTAITQALRDSAGNQPTFQIVDLISGAATETYPKPKLYALVTFVVVLLLSLRLSFVVRKPQLS